MDEKKDSGRAMLAAEKAMDRYWTHRSESYSDMNRRELQSEQRTAWETLLFEGVDEARPLRILDIGAGPGFFSILCAKRGHIVTAADMNKEMIRQAKENAAAAGAAVEFVQVDHTLPFAPGSFDMIVSRNVTWALPQPDETMAIWGSLLRTGGMLRYFDAEWYNYLADDSVRPEEMRLRDYSRSSEMEKLAYSLPMTFRRRPEWDRVFWQAAGYGFEVRENLNSLVYDENDMEKYRSFSLFMATVRKTASPQAAELTL